MGWEEDYRRERECPCGSGKYREIHYSNDWNGSRVERVMLCPSCRVKYVYDSSLDKSYHPRDEVERGWVLKAEFEKGKKAKNRGKGIKKVKKARRE